MAHNRQESRFLSAPEYAYLATLALFFTASFFLDAQLWGVNVWGYFPIWVRFLLFGAGLLGLPTARYWTRASKQHPMESSRAQSGRLYWLVSCGILVAFGLLFYLLRAKTHFLGDGYMLLSMLADGKPLVKSRGLGEGLAHLWMKSLIGGEAERAALLSYQVISIGAGLAFLASALLSAKLMFTELRDRLLFALGLGSGGYMLLFFGYVENYSLFCLSILLFTVIGVLVSRGRTPKWLIVLPLGLAVFFHVLGVTLVPSVLYLLIAGTQAGDRLARVDRMIKWLLACVLVAAGGTLFVYFYTTDFFFRFAFVPLVRNQFTVDGYTLFSASHLLDYVNLIFLLVPGLLVLLASFPWSRSREFWCRLEMRFLLILTVCTLGAAFVFDPKLGMPRDWDLFSFPGAPVVCLGVLAVMSSQLPNRVKTLVVGLVIAIGWCTLLPRAGTVADDDRSFEQVRSYYRLDRAKSAPGRTMLIDRLTALGRLDEAAIEASLSERDYPEGDTLDAAHALFLQGKARDAIALCRFVVHRSPTLYGGWLLQGMGYNQLGKFDSALRVLEVADGLNPHNAQTCEEIALARFATHQLSGVEALWCEALALDSTRLRPLLGLAALYQETGRQEDFRGVFSRIIRRDDAPAEYLRMAGDSFLAQGRADLARNFYGRALKAGLDTAYVRSLAVKYPQLEGLL